MPLFLRRESIRMLESSLNALHKAFNSLTKTKRFNIREKSSENAISIGLIGVSTELAMSACLIHAHGLSIQKRESGNYKSFPEILDDFRKLVTEARPISDFLVEGASNSSLHRQELESRTSNFGILSTVRAGGLHAGKGPNTEAAIYQANETAKFLKCLAKSDKIKPYLDQIPDFKHHEKDRTLILEDVAKKVKDSSGSDKESAILSIFLVLPDIPDKKPEWVDLFEKVTIAPKSRDVSYLLDVLDSAVPANLKRANQAGRSIPVKVDQENPDALPISTSYLKREFNKRRDQLFADIGSANGRLNEGHLDLPPAAAVKEMFAVGLNEAGLLEEANFLTAHEAWPFIASSLNIQGTKGPFWFLVRKTNDLGQLKSLINQAIEVGGPRLKRKSTQCLEGIEAISNEKPVEKADKFEEVINDLKESEINRSKLPKKYDRHKNSEKGLPEELKGELDDIVNGSTVENIINNLRINDYTNSLRNYWIRVFAEVALDQEDLLPLIDVLNDSDLKNTHTSVRKAFRRIDFRLNGPTINAV